MSVMYTGTVMQMTRDQTIIPDRSLVYCADLYTWQRNKHKGRGGGYSFKVNLPLSLCYLWAQYSVLFNFPFLAHGYGLLPLGCGHQAKSSSTMSIGAHHNTNLHPGFPEAFSGLFDYVCTALGRPMVFWVPQ